MTQSYHIVLSNDESDLPKFGGSSVQIHFKIHNVPHIFFPNDIVIFTVEGVHIHMRIKQRHIKESSIVELICVCTSPDARIILMSFCVPLFPESQKTKSKILTVSDQFWKNKI